MFITKKQYKRDRAIMCGAMGVSGAIGAAGTTLGVIAIVKSKNAKTDVDTIHTDIERRLAAEEGMTRQFSRAISQMQDVLEKHEMLRVKH